MKQFIESVVDSIVQSGLVEVEVSARHVHLTQEDVELLFGKGAVLHPKRPLSQPGQFLSEERVTLIGPKGKKERVADQCGKQHRWNFPSVTAWHWE